nr:DDE-type integrase/transposase/recombinase [Ruegeria profundi]
MDEILQSKQDRRAAERLLHRLIKQLGFSPKRFITDKMRSYGAVKRVVARGSDQRSCKGLTNRTENSHLRFL